MLTSGTKGMSKIAKNPFIKVYGMVLLPIKKWFEIQGADTILSTVPLTHSYGLIGACLGAFYSGATLYLCKKSYSKKGC